MEYDRFIINGTIVDTQSSYKADIAIKNGKIVAVVEPGTLISAGDIKNEGKCIDADGKLVLPGLIEPHMHVAAPFSGTIDILDFVSAGEVGAFGGVTSFMDFSTTTSDTEVLTAVANRKEEMAKGALDYGVHAKFITASESDIASIEQLVNGGVPSFKMFTTYEGVKIKDEDILEILTEAKKQGALCGFHAECDAISRYNRKKFTDEGRVECKDFPDWKPSLCEAEAVYRILCFAEFLDVSVYFYHLSTKESVEMVRAAKARGVKVYAETCCHYLALTRDCCSTEYGINYLMSPPLRTKEDQEALWRAIADGTIDIVSSDNEVFMMSQKKAQYRKDGKENVFNVVNGTPGLEERFGILMKACCDKRITINKFVEIACANPAKVFGCYPQKGCIQPGSDADIVIVDPKKEWKLCKENLHYKDDKNVKLDYDLYDHITSPGKPIITIRRGDILMEDETYKGIPNSGQFIHRCIAEK